MNIIQCPYYITLYNHMGQIAGINISKSVSIKERQLQLNYR